MLCSLGETGTQKAGQVDAFSMRSRPYEESPEKKITFSHLSGFLLGKKQNAFFFIPPKRDDGVLLLLRFDASLYACMYLRKRAVRTYLQKETACSSNLA
jgi:hypothetical protein